MTTLLTLPKAEKIELTAFYIDTVKDAFLGEFPVPDEDAVYWIGLQINERMFDLCVYWHDGEIGCVVYECDWINDNWQTNTTKSWLLTEQEWV